MSADLRSGSMWWEAARRQGVLLLLLQRQRVSVGWLGGCNLVVCLFWGFGMRENRSASMWKQLLVQLHAVLLQRPRVITKGDPLFSGKRVK